MKYKYAIVDLENYSAIRFFDEDTDAVKKELYVLRKQRYTAEHPGRPSWEYDKMKHDNGYNLVKYTVIA